MTTTIKDILQSYESFKIPRLDLEILLARIMECSRTKLYSHPELEVLKKYISELKKLSKQRYKGKPIAYLINCKEFYGIEFFVDERVLIPRPETELIIDEVDCEPMRILDIGTGSGVIGLTLATKYKKAEATLIDICPKALEVTEMNREKLGIRDRTTLLNSSLIEDIKPGSEFDVITTNLPYIGEETFNYVSKETLEYEPKGALFAGSDGLDLYRELFRQIKEKEIKFKQFIGEFGFGQAELMREELTKHFNNFELKDDLAGIPRIFVVR